jgi:hypothetical protein
MRELIYTSSREMAKGHNVQRTVTEHHLRDSETGRLTITKTTTFKCACGENKLEGSVPMNDYQEYHQQLMEDAQ